MLPPKSASDRTRPRRTVDDDRAWRSGDSTREDEACELCQSRTETSVEYGLRVCAVCDETLLP